MQISSTPSPVTSPILPEKLGILSKLNEYLSTSPAGGSAFVLLLKEVDGDRKLPIIIGHFEAQSMAFVIEKYVPERPNTYDLLKSVIDNLGANVVEVVIYDLIQNTYYSNIVLDVSGFSNEVDARPSDAINLALRAKVPIYVSEKVLDEAGFYSARETSKGDEEDESSEKSSIREAKLSALQNQLRELLEKEDYEQAAKVRDQISKLGGKSN
jgi:bifunctional DNase/RNase